MGSAKRLLIAVSIMVVVSVIVPSVAYCQGSDDASWPVRTTFTMPVRIGSMVLAPGTYDLRLTQGTWARNVVAIYSVDQKRWMGMVMGINDSRQDTSKMSGFTFERIGSDVPVALEYWFYEDWNRGVKFVYHEGANVDAMAGAVDVASK